MPDDIPSEKPIEEGNPAVQVHLGILQSVISRMGVNSSSVKAWCITLVSAILVVVTDKGKPEYLWIAILPTALFFALDAYYLALEVGFRNTYNMFVKRLHERSIRSADLFSVQPTGRLLPMTLRAMKSFSIWPLYLTLIITVFSAKMLLTNPTTPTTTNTPSIAPTNAPLTTPPLANPVPSQPSPTPLPNTMSPPTKGSPSPTPAHAPASTTPPTAIPASP